MFEENTANEQTYEFDGSGLNDSSSLDNIVLNASYKLTINIHQLENIMVTVLKLGM